jgi:FtsZ-binding cell division protein ZapB
MKGPSGFPKQDSAKPSPKGTPSPKGEKPPVPPGAFRIWLGRLSWGLVLLFPLGGFVLVLLMIAAENRGLERSRTVMNAANSILSSAMIEKKPESVPLAIKHLGEATHTTIVLLRNDGSSAYADRRVLDRLKTYTPIPDDWKQAIHSPDLFLWPPAGLPGRLSREIDRVFSLRSAHLVADNHGEASPLALKGGYAAWVQAIPNKPSCASCHGFDKEVLGHWVTVSRVDAVVNRRGTALWGFWPLPSINQQFLFLSTAGLSVFAVFLVSVLETWTLRRGYRALVAKKNPPGKKGDEGKEIEGAGGGLIADPDQRPVSHGDWEELHQRLEMLDQSILALVEEIPRSGVLPGSRSDNVISIQTSLSEMLSDWSDRFEMALQELESHPATESDPVLSRFIEKAREFRSQAVSFADTAQESEAQEKTQGILKAPFFESLTEEEKEWTDRLRAVLGHLHAEIRAMEGVTKSGKARSESPKQETPQSPKPEPSKK